jgi:LysM repeat protein
MNGLMTAREILNEEKSLLSLYRRLRNRVIKRSLSQMVNELIEYQLDQIALLNELIEELGDVVIPWPHRRLAQYEVQEGDTLFLIAKKYNTTVANILRVNPDIEDPDNIRVGMIINLPIFLAMTPDCFERYTVKTGDTLVKIAQRFDVSINQLVCYNNIRNSDLIFPGRILIIPCSDEIGDEIEEGLNFDTIIRRNLEFEIPDEERFFVVNTGSQLKRILDRFNISTPENINFNNNIVMGAIEYNIDDLESEDRNITAVVSRQEGEYHLIAIPKGQFYEKGCYMVNFMTPEGRELVRKEIEIVY